MSQPSSHSFGSLLRKARKPLLLLLLSFVLATLLVNSGSFWQLVSWVPRAITEGFVRLLDAMLSPIRPAEVHTQEKQLEFFIAWCFSGVSFGVFYLLFFAARAASRIARQMHPNISIESGSPTAPAHLKR